MSRVHDVEVPRVDMVLQISIQLHLVTKSFRLSAAAASGGWERRRRAVKAAGGGEAGDYGVVRSKKRGF